MKRTSLILSILLLFAGGVWGNKDINVEDYLGISEKQAESLFKKLSTEATELFCRSKEAFQLANYDLQKCYDKADKELIYPLRELLKKTEFKGVNLDGRNFDYLDGQDSALLNIKIMISFFNECFYENNLKARKTPTNSILIEGCEKKYRDYLEKVHSEADGIAKQVYLRSRGIFEDNQIKKKLKSKNITQSPGQELKKLLSDLSQEFEEVYCRSGFGIRIKNKKDCVTEAREWLSNLDEWVVGDKKNFKLSFLSLDMIKAFGTQYNSIVLDKCAPHTLTWNESNQDRVLEQFNECLGKTMSGYEWVLKEANLIAKKDYEWEQEIKRQEKLRIAKAKNKKRKEIEKKKAEERTRREKENSSELFARIFVAALTGAAEAYIQEKITKELGIKTGTYHSQDLNYCYYSTPTGLKSLKKPKGKRITIGEGIPRYQKNAPGVRTKTTTYNFGTSKLVSRKTYIYKCPSKI